MAEYDLTSRVGKYLDRHLVFPLIEFLTNKDVYDDQDLLHGKYELLVGTNMVDYAMDIYKQLHKTDQPSDELVQKREQVLERMNFLQDECRPFAELLENPEVVAELKKDKLFNMDYLVEHFEFAETTSQRMYELGKFHFETGNYNLAIEYLAHYRLLTEDPEKSFSALWGIFAGEILMQNWEAAFESMSELRTIIEDKVSQFMSPLHQLQQRTWLIHWSLFVFFNHSKGRDGIIDMFLQPQYVNTIQTTCPHILRYLTTAVITNKRRRTVLKDLVQVIQQESYTYRDPITEFLECLYVNFDFDAAQQKLRECEKVLSNDFFVVGCIDEFVENARLFIFETYCRIHQCIDIEMLAEKLNMTPIEAERWIVNLIRNARLDAKIDSKQNTVVMGTQYPSLYQQVIEKTKGLTFRSHVMSSSLEKRATQPAEHHHQDRDRDQRRDYNRDNRDNRREPNVVQNKPKW